MLFLSASGAGRADEITWNQAKNLARMNCDAWIEGVTPSGRLRAGPITTVQNQSPGALIVDDGTFGCPLDEGTSTFTVTLPKAAVLNRFGFINENAAAQGELDVSVSNYRLPSNDSRWIPLATAKSFTGKQLFSISVAAVEAKYIKFAFHVSKKGQISGLAVYGEQTLDEFARGRGEVALVSYDVTSPGRRSRPENVLNFNFANLYAHGRVVYVSSGPIAPAPRMIDDDVETEFRFSSSDASPTVIVELARSQQIHRVAARYQTQAGRLDVYLFNEFPKDPAHLGDFVPTAWVVDRSGEGKAAVDFDSQSARFVAFRWTPDQPRRDGFEFSEVAAFGYMPLSVLDRIPDPRPLLNQGGWDFSNRLGTLAEPPVIGVVSPP
jgi:hypothetical protein